MKHQLPMDKILYGDLKYPAETRNWIKYFIVF